MRNFLARRQAIDQAQEARGWPVWSLDSNAGVPPESADYPSIPTIPGLIGVTAHHLCSTTTKTSDTRPEQSCGTRHWHTGPRSQLVIVSFKGFQFNIKLLKQVFGAQF